jgi:ATP-dependent DNA ligase
MPIEVMLLDEVRFDDSVFDTYKDWIFQEKQNGTRVLLHIKDGKASAIQHRAGNPMLHLFPEIQALKFPDELAILDGEIVVFDDKQKSVFYGGINQRDKKLHTQNIKKFPVCFVAFDIIYHKGEVVINKPYAERYALLKHYSQYSCDNFKVVENVENPREYWANKIDKENREGFVIKNPKGLYESGTRSKNNLKLKNYKIVDVKVFKTETNPKGIKIYGTGTYKGEVVETECQFSGNNMVVNVGDILPVEFLDIINGKLVQPHKIIGWKNGEVV